MASGLSFVEYTASAGQTAFGPVSFPGGDALRSSHIKAYVNGTLATATVSGALSGPTVTLASGASAGDTVRIQRETPNTADDRVVDFEDGSVVKSQDLDDAFLSALYAAQEMASNIGSSGGALPLDLVSGHYNANNKRITNLQSPSSSGDAASKTYVDTADATKEALSSAASPATSNSSSITLQTALTAAGKCIQITNGTNTALAMTIGSGTYFLALLVRGSTGLVTDMTYFGKFVTSADSVLTITPPAGGNVQGYIRRTA